MSHVLGFDIGGANIKAAHTAGRGTSRAFALWKAPDRLADELRAVLEGVAPFGRVAVTMTGELCDCFESKREGILHILGAAESVAAGVPVWVWTNEGRFVSLAQARAKPLPAASANWLALATVAGRQAPPGPALLIDIGTTTTDIIPLVDGEPTPTGRTDPERYRANELLYVGWRRTPLCALMGPTLPAEWYATTADAYLLLKVVPENPKDTDTADGRPLTRAAANRRLSRMLGGDLETITQRECDDLAREVAFKVSTRIAMAANEVIRRMPGPPRAVIASGSGECLVGPVLSSPIFDTPMTRCPVISLGKLLGESGFPAGCALAVAVLCQEQQPA